MRVVRKLFYGIFVGNFILFVLECIFVGIFGKIVGWGILGVGLIMFFVVLELRIGLLMLIFRRVFLVLIIV